MSEGTKSAKLQSVFARIGNHPFFEELDELTVNSIDMVGDTMLHHAAVLDDVDAVRVLLECGANPNIQGDMSCTPLHDAILFERHEIARMLLQNGASLTLKDEFGQTPLEAVAESEDRKMAEVFETFALETRKPPPRRR